jgi:hypothetical protein
MISIPVQFYHCNEIDSLQNKVYETLKGHLTPLAQRDPLLAKFTFSGG